MPGSGTAPRWLPLLLFLAMLPPAAAGATPTLPPLPCDILRDAGTPCVAAHSTTRALYANYSGPLYEVRRSSDKHRLDVGPLFAGGPANASRQEVFCAGVLTSCVILRIYDQSPNQNHLATAPPGEAIPLPDRGCNAAKDKISVFGGTAGTAGRYPVPVYGARFEGLMGYRNDTTTGMAVGDQAESIFAVFSGTHYNNFCCFDYGNAETDNKNDHTGTMEALYFGNAKGRLNHGGAGKGPWIMGDLESGLWGADVVESNETAIRHAFVTAVLKGDSGPAPGHWALKGGDAQQGNLTVFWDGARPSGYAPMKKQGAIILGIGGDNSALGVGTFYEGCIVKGYTTAATDEDVQRSIVDAGYRLP